jgi:hypothetical protein
MKFENIAQLNTVSIDEIHGVIDGGRRTVIKRRRSGWEVHLVIEVNGHTFHDDKASAEDREEFNKLWERAVTEAYEARETAKGYAMSAARVHLTVS